jgi:hypothetical protein
MNCKGCLVILHPERRLTRQVSIDPLATYDGGALGRHFRRKKKFHISEDPRPEFTKEEFVVTYLLVNKLLEILRHGIPPNTWAIRHDLCFQGKRVINQKRIENLFGKADDFKQALASDRAHDLKRAMDDLIRACLHSKEVEAPA